MSNFPFLGNVFIFLAGGKFQKNYRLNVWYVRACLFSFDVVVRSCSVIGVFGNRVGFLCWLSGVGILMYSLSLGLLLWCLLSFGFSWQRVADVGSMMGHAQ